MDEGIVLLHGIGRSARSMATMGRSLEMAGFSVLNLGYASRRADLAGLAEQVGGGIAAFAAGRATVHIVTHSMGGLVVRVLLGRAVPSWLGKVVMLGPPNHGSDLADRLHRSVLYRGLFGPAGQQLTTAACAALARELPAIAYPLGIVAGRRFPSALLLPGPSDGKVTIRSTRLPGMTDHVVVRAAHPWLMRGAAAIAQTIAFLRTGHFDRG